MATHVAILLRRYIRLILEGRKTIESRLTRTPRVPFRAIKPGDRIYFKCSGGPYMASAVAGEVTFHDDLTPAKVEELRQRYNHAVCGDDEYWQWKSDSRYATFIALREVKPSREGPPLPPSKGPAWFVCEPSPLPGDARVTLTAGAIRNRYVRLAQADVSSGGEGQRPVELLLPDGARVPTMIRGNNMIRWRGWGQYFREHQLAPGDVIHFEPLGPWQYRVNFERAGIAVEPPAAPAGDLATDAEMQRLARYISQARLRQLIRQAKAEDLGPAGRDITSQSLVPPNVQAMATIRARQEGVLCGAVLLREIAAAYDPGLTLQRTMEDGERLARHSIVAEISGSLRSILALERVALNFLTHLSGISSLTARYVEAVVGTAVRIYDTRKTLPGLRGLEKYAVACGGGVSHRMGLYDAMLVKDNHIAHLDDGELASRLTQAIAVARQADNPPTFVEVEVDTLAQLQIVLTCPVDVVLLDNMTPPQLRNAVMLRDRLAPGIELEASGGINLDTVRQAAQSGVERIAIGALTHSAPALDLGMDILT